MKLTSKTLSQLFALIFLAFGFSLQANAAGGTPSNADYETMSDRIVGKKWGTFKLKVSNTSAEKWRLTWYCFGTNNDGTVNLGNRTKIDRDTFPSSSGTSRETLINENRCPSGFWAVAMEIDYFGTYKNVKTEGGVCSESFNCGAEVNLKGRLETETFGDYIPNSWFMYNNGKKACTKAWNFAFNNIYIEDKGSVPMFDIDENGNTFSPHQPNDKKFETTHYNCS